MPLFALQQISGKPKLNGNLVRLMKKELLLLLLLLIKSSQLQKKQLPDLKQLDRCVHAHR